MRYGVRRRNPALDYSMAKKAAPVSPMKLEAIVLKGHAPVSSRRNEGSSGPVSFEPRHGLTPQARRVPAHTPPCSGLLFSSHLHELVRHSLPRVNPTYSPGLATLSIEGSGAAGQIVQSLLWNFWV